MSEKANRDYITKLHFRCRKRLDLNPPLPAFAGCSTEVTLLYGIIQKHKE